MKLWLANQRYFLELNMIINIEEMLSEDIINTINILNNELLKKEKSKGIIDLEIHKEKGDICCPDCKNKILKKMENTKKDNYISVKNVIENLTS